VKPNSDPLMVRLLMVGAFLSYNRTAAGVLADAADEIMRLRERVAELEARKPKRPAKKGGRR
jgi:hypothetical protein